MLLYVVRWFGGLGAIVWTCSEVIRFADASCSAQRCLLAVLIFENVRRGWLHGRLWALDYRFIIRVHSGVHFSLDESIAQVTCEAVGKH